MIMRMVANKLQALAGVKLRSCTLILDPSRGMLRGIYTDKDGVTRETAETKTDSAMISVLAAKVKTHTPERYTLELDYLTNEAKVTGYGKDKNGTPQVLIETSTF